MKIILLLVVLPFSLFAQTYGPNNPSVGTNVTGIGTLAWTNAANIFTSNNSYASEGTKGTTNYLQGTGFGFGLLNTDIVAGIRLQIEKSSQSVLNVTLSGPWSTGTTRAAIPAGNNRCLVVIIGLENSSSRDITAVSYGGKAMLPITDIGLGNPVFFARTEAWYLLESDLATAVGTTIAYTFAASVPAENFEIVSSAVYTNVDQFQPFNDFAATSTAATGVSYQFGQPIGALEGSMSVVGIFCGNPPSGNQAIGNCNGYSINSSFSEQIDFHNANTPTFSTSGGVLSVSQKPGTTIATEQPTWTFNGSPNRQTAVGFSIRRARQMDNSVRILKAGALIGTEHAATNIEWPTNDAYTTYGSASDLWGTSWNFSDINNLNFGASLSAIIQNGTANVDHMRFSIFTTTVLPLELVSFTASRDAESVTCNWITASERDFDRFVVERSTNGFDFTAIGTVKAAGNSQQALSYLLTDTDPQQGANYYRLKMVDVDGSYDYSDIILQEFSSAGKGLIYPNPTSDWTTVMTTQGFDEIVITDALGHIVDRFEGTSLQTKQELNLYDRPDGVYFVCIRKGSGTQISKLMKTSRMAN